MKLGDLYIIVMIFPEAIYIYIYRLRYSHFSLPKKGKLRVMDKEKIRVFEKNILLESIGKARDAEKENDSAV